MSTATEAVLADVVTIREATQILRCSSTTVSNLMRGKISTRTPFPHFLIGRRKYTRRSWIHKWMEENREK